MGVSAEFQLIALAVGLYAYDSMLLLYPNEGVLTAVGTAGWRVSFGSNNTRVRGKEILFPNLFLPHRPIYKLTWDYEGATQQVPTVGLDWGAKKNLFSGLVIPIYAIGIAQFLVFPYVILFFLTDLSIIISILYLYGSILIALFYIHRKRESLYISKRQLLTLIFECLVCPPVAVNLIRKLSLELPRFKEDLLVVSKNLLEAEAWNVTKDKFIGRLSEAIDFEDEDSTRYANMVANRANLIEESENECIRNTC